MYPSKSFTQGLNITASAGSVRTYPAGTKFNTNWVQVNQTRAAPAYERPINQFDVLKFKHNNGNAFGEVRTYPQGTKFNTNWKTPNQDVDAPIYPAYSSAEAFKIARAEGLPSPIEQSEQDLLELLKLLMRTVKPSLKQKTREIYGIALLNPRDTLVINFLKNLDKETLAAAASKMNVNSPFLADTINQTLQSLQTKPTPSVQVIASALAREIKPITSVEYPPIERKELITRAEAVESEVPQMIEQLPPESFGIKGMPARDAPLFKTGAEKSVPELRKTFEKKPKKKKQKSPEQLIAKLEAEEAKLSPASRELIRQAEEILKKPPEGKYDEPEEESFEQMMEKAQKDLQKQVASYTKDALSSLKKNTPKPKRGAEMPQYAPNDEIQMTAAHASDLYYNREGVLKDISKTKLKNIMHKLGLSSGKLTKPDMIVQIHAIDPDIISALWHAPEKDPFEVRMYGEGKKKGKKTKGKKKPKKSKK